MPGIPGKVVEIVDEEKQLGHVDVGGVRRLTQLACVAMPDRPQELLGTWVLVHVGFAMARISPEEAERTLALLREMGEIAESQKDPTGTEYPG